MKYDIKKIKKYVDDGLLLQIKHFDYPEVPLSLYRYSLDCTYERKWDDITINMRSTVLDDNGKVISNPFPKFFNHDELVSLGIKRPKENYKIFEKLDGSFIQIFKYNDDIIFTSSKSFTSDFVVEAEKIFYEKYNINMIDFNKTYIFELIHPLNKIVVDYGDIKRLVLLSVRNNENGYEYPLETFKKLGFDTVKLYDKLNITKIKSILKKKSFNNEEGFVILHENGFRIKMKYDEYIRLHKIISTMNEKSIWEALKDGVKLNLNDIPDEIFNEIKSIKKELCMKFCRIALKGEYTYNDVVFQLDKKHGKNKWSKKDFALYVKKHHPDQDSLLFNIHSNNDYEEHIWKKIKPKLDNQLGTFNSWRK